MALNDGGCDLFSTVEGAVVGDNQFQQSLVKNANSLSSNYNRAQNHYVRLFMESIEANPSLEKACALVDDPHLGPGVKSPHFIVVCRGQSPADNPKAFKVMNKLLVNFLYSSKKGNGKHLSASTWSTRVKTLLSALKRDHGFQYTTGDFKGFDGSLYDVSVKLWEQLSKEDPSFSRSSRGSYSERDYQQVKAFLESDGWLSVVSHGNNVMAALNHAIGTSYALRGRDEHHTLTWGSFELGRYPDNHPSLGGCEYLALKDKDMLTKTNKLKPGEYFFCFVDWTSQQSSHSFRFLFRERKRSQSFRVWRRQSRSCH